ncbi:GNAT family N-acetyltransferase [Legionella sp. D16C41]|uniref:GNAT family N-acetyltransferase n=1 Tax=Legionella sp. D16C41 TaxID=3402688 RepID=UPI003AF6B896
MTIATYQSKRIGPVTININNNGVTISSERLELKSLNQGNQSYLITQYKLLLGSLENTKLFGEGNVWSEKAVEEFVLSAIACWNRKETFGVFAVYDKQTKTFLGSLSVSQALDDFAHIGTGHRNAAEIGYIIDKQFGGKGYGTEIAILGKKYIKHFNAETKQTLQNNIKEIVATVHPLNEGSKKILQKTLKHQEPQEFKKFGDKPRILFFKPLKAPLESSNFSNKIINP